MTVSIAKEVALKPLGKRVLQHLRNRGSISPLECFASHGTMRLAAQIGDLRKAGYDIRTEMKEDEEKQKYARYYLYVDGKKPTRQAA